jgi:hypothetical protein
MKRRQPDHECPACGKRGKCNRFVGEPACDLPLKILCGTCASTRKPPQVRTVADVILTRMPEFPAHWRGVVDREPWVFFLRPDGKWGGYHGEHLSGAPRCFTLKDTVEWVKQHRSEIAQKLGVRRGAGTRMVDPALRPRTNEGLR